MIGNVDDGTRTYNCRKRPAEPRACGGIVVRAALVEAKVRRELVALLNDRPRVEALLERYRLADPAQAAIDARFAELQDAKTTLEDDFYNPPPGMKRLPQDRYWTLRTQIEVEQEQLQRRRTVSREAEPLRAALRESWTEEAWEAKPLEYRRAILRIACERIEVVRDDAHGAAKKGQLGGTHNPERVRITFADE